MTIQQGILGAIAIAASTAASAEFELGCVRLDLSSSGAVCAGTLAPVNVMIENSCGDTKRVALTFAMDREPLRAQSASIVPGEERIRKAVMVEIPESIAPGTRTMTVTARDIEGNSSGTNVRWRVVRCDSVGS